jgi:AcrR family transcriptional regulator
MARIVKDYTVRRDEILDSAQRLVYTKGYEQMTIQHILDDLQIAKGTFYHYFGSKEALLEAVIERMIDVVEELITPLMDDPNLSPLEKFQHYFDSTTRLKTEHKPFLIALARGWYTDSNIVVREKARASGIRRIKPLLTAVIQQGAQDGTFTTAYPDHVGDVVFALMAGLGEDVNALLLSADLKPDDLNRLEGIVAAYTDAIERVLGITSGALHLVDSLILNEWLIALIEA